MDQNAASATATAEISADQSQPRAVERTFIVARNAIIDTVESFPPPVQVDALGQPGDGVIAAAGRCSPQGFDAHWLPFVRSLRQPTTLSKAIRDFAEMCGQDPQAIFPHVLPLIRALSERRWLRLADEASIEAEALPPYLAAGNQLGD